MSEFGLEALALLVRPKRAFHIALGIFGLGKDVETFLMYIGGGGYPIMLVVQRHAIFKGTFFKDLQDHGNHFQTFPDIMGVFVRNVVEL